MTQDITQSDFWSTLGRITVPIHDNEAFDGPNLYTTIPLSRSALYHNYHNYPRCQDCRIDSTRAAFAALTEDGTVIFCGDPDFAGNNTYGDPGRVYC